MSFSTLAKVLRNRLLRPLALGLIVVIDTNSHPAPIAAMVKQDSTSLYNQSPAQALVDSLVGRNFTAATANFSPQLRSIITPEQLQQIWETITQDLGDFQKVTEITRQTSEGVEVFIVVCQFAKDSLRIQIGVNSDRQIAGFQILPIQTAQVFPTPSYADPSKFTEQEVQIGTGANPLPGTLTIPKGERPFPVVVLVHGSGPNDRDETIGGNKPFRDLAWGLASLGIAVLRYDKRTLVYPQEFQGNFTVQEEVVQDALNAVDFLRQTALTNPQINSQRIYSSVIASAECSSPELAWEIRKLPV